MRQSLALKLTAAVLLVSLLSVALVAIFTRLAIVSAFDRLREEQRSATVLEAVTEYYEDHDTLEGVDAVLRRWTPDADETATVVVLDENGSVVFPQHMMSMPQMGRGRMAGRQGHAITVDDEVVGTVMDFTPVQYREPEEELYLRRTQRALVLAAIGASAFALLIGGWLARTLTRPLGELTKATEAVADGHLEQRVPVRTRDELGQLAAAFNRMSSELARSIRLRKQMTADIAHDLRTPLSVIKGYTEALRDGDLPAAPETFETMYQEAELLNHLIDDLRILSLADAGELVLNRRPTAVDDLLEQSQAAHLPQAIARNVSIVVDVAETMPELPLDFERMSRVLDNLISNALRYTPAGGQITLSGRATAGGAVISVRDTGSGIAPDQLPHIFDRFYRGDAARQTETGESGLGLAIARSLVEAHGGSISAHSTPGDGALFEITLPGTV